MAEENKKLNKKKILFIGGSSGRDDLMSSVSKELESRHEIKPYYLCFSNGSKQYVSERGFPTENIFSKVFEKDNNIRSPNLKYLRSAEDAYNFRIWDLWQIDAPRRRSRLKLPQSLVLSKMEYVIREIEDTINKINPDWVLITGIAGSHLVILYHILLAKNIRVLELTNARLPQRFTFNNNLEDRWPLLVKNYEETKKSNLSEPDLDFAENLIKEFKIKKFKPDDSKKVKESLSDKFKKYKYYLGVLRHRKKLPDLRQWFLYPIKDKFIRHSKVFENPKDNEKFTFYPLQIQPEASTSIMGKWYMNQVALIDVIAKSLPCNYKLYVKEHIKDFGSRPANFYKEIKKNPNVRLIKSSADSFNLIQKSSLNFTITGTAGWESVLLQKPVLTFGNVFYNVFDRVKKVEKISDLPKLIKERLDTVVDRDSTLKFLASMNKATFEGIAALPGDCQNRSLEPSNISKLVGGIEKYVELL